MTQDAAYPRHLAEARVGLTLKGKWRLDRLIEIGGVAAVYAATHRNGKRVAVKVLHPIFPTDSSMRERFLREGYLANKVSHPGAVSVLDDDTAEDGTAFLVMELLDGHSLEQVLERVGGTLAPAYVLAVADQVDGVIVDTARAQLAPAYVLAVADQVLDVLGAAHAAGIVHRDIKPSNLMLTRDGHVKVLDFGLARLLEQGVKGAVTAVGIVMGTSAYMAPEQARSQRHLVDGRSDLFSLGAVMFRALSGQVVHGGESARERLLAAQSKPVRSLAEAAPTAASCVVRLVDKALAFDKAARWADAPTMQIATRNALAILQSTPSVAPADVAPARAADRASPARAAAAPHRAAAAPAAPRAPERKRARPVQVADPHLSRLEVDDLLCAEPAVLESMPEVSAALVSEIAGEPSEAPTVQEGATRPRPR